MRHEQWAIGQDTYYVGTIKGVGRIYKQTFVLACPRSRANSMLKRSHSSCCQDESIADRAAFMINKLGFILHTMVLTSM
jgi:hypothetical protein